MERLPKNETVLMTIMYLRLYHYYYKSGDYCCTAHCLYCDYVDEDRVCVEIRLEMGVVFMCLRKCRLNTPIFDQFVYKLMKS